MTKAPSKNIDWKWVEKRKLEITEQVCKEEDINDPLDKYLVRDYAWIAAQMEAYDKPYRTFMNSIMSNPIRASRGLPLLSYEYKGSGTILKLPRGQNDA